MAPTVYFTSINGGALPSARRGENGLSLTNHPTHPSSNLLSSGTGFEVNQNTLRLPLGDADFRFRKKISCWSC